MDSDSEYELIKSEKVGRPLILGMLPKGYTYKMVTVTHFKDLDSFICELKIKLGTEESVRKWVADYNEKRRRKPWCTSAAKTKVEKESLKNYTSVVSINRGRLESTQKVIKH